MKTNNTREIGKFVEYHSLGDNADSLLIIVNLYVKYAYNGTSIDCKAEVQLKRNTIDYGFIEIISDRLNSRKIHTGFNPHFGTYFFNSRTGKLEITDTSNGINDIVGKYTVYLSPYPDSDDPE